jgi:hypothetical protein
MTYGWLIPFTFEHVQPDAPRKRGPTRRRGHPPTRYTDAQVIDAITCQLGGETFASIALRLQCSESAVIAWCKGLTRAHCYTEAEKRWRKKLSPHA